MAKHLNLKKVNWCVGYANKKERRLYANKYRR